MGVVLRAARITFEAPTQVYGFSGAAGRHMATTLVLSGSHLQRLTSVIYVTEPRLKFFLGLPDSLHSRGRGRDAQTGRVQER